MTTLDWLANLWTAFVSLLPVITVGLGIWFAASLAVSPVIGWVLRERGRQ